MELKVAKKFTRKTFIMSKHETEFRQHFNLFISDTN